MNDVHYYGYTDLDGVIIVTKLDGGGSVELPVYKIDAQSLYDLLRMHCGDLFVPGVKSDIQKSAAAVVLRYEPIFDVNGEGSYIITEVDAGD